MQVWISTATEILYVSPDNSTNISCPSQPDTDTLQFLVHCQGITLLYSKQQYKSHLIINQITINSNECYNNNPIGMEIIILEVENLIIIIKNSLFYELDHTALSINSKYYSNNIIIIENCTFNLNFLAIYNSVYYQITPKSLIDILLSHGNKSIIFKNCNFESNQQINGHLISFFVQTSKKFYIRTKICVDPLTNISFMGCQFNDNVGELLTIKGNLCRPNLFIIGHSYFVNNLAGLNAYENYSLIYISSMVTYIDGLLTASMNHANTILHFKSCNITFSQNVILKSNECDQFINLQFAYIKIM